MHSTASTTRAARFARIAVIPAGLLVSGLIVGQASYSAFTATTVNPINNWSSGTVALTDDDTNIAMFTATKLAPGSTGTKCIVVTSSGTVPSAVKLYGTTPATTNAFSGSINLSVVQGTGGTFGSCTGFTALATGSSVFTGTLAGFGTAATSFGTGTGNWAPTGTAAESRTYQFTYTVDAGAPNTTQGSTASIGFTWEAQSS
ncbi:MULTISPECIES: hypothetical protein [Cryobacterium]|uniref:Camelysin metallo-endopeptidase n=1 Tax=Cryobacterium breve TaxID=1259258 RepID=A0ABY2J5Y2_9MICO|nr:MULTISPECIES: hypothetical protein [Cryobacterium]TFC95201.1 hypothetical protein E3T20_06280 [Cryobacterium sp. TmT3-12]TFD00343.1 hypothetical protein E3O65_04385 [Cryobacterium breve]